LRCSMTGMRVQAAALVHEASDFPQLSALHCTALPLNRRAEAAMPEVQAQRGLPDEPLFCFETCLKACYLALHSYRHFRVRGGC